MPIHENKTETENLIIDSMIAALHDSKTGYDIYSVIKNIIKSYKFEYFMVGKLPNNLDKSTNIEILLSNWSSEYLMEFHNRVMNSENMFLKSFYSRLQASYFDNVQERQNATDKETIEILEFLLRNRRCLSVQVPLKYRGSRGIMIFSRESTEKDMQTIVDLTYLANLIFAKTLEIGSVSPILTCPLSSKELLCTKMISDGLELSKISDIMKISVHTVTYHLNNAVKKVNARSRLHLVSIAIRSEWID